MTPAALHDLLICDPAAGTLTWRHRSVSMFEDGSTAKASVASWNTRFAAKPALNCLSDKGYRHGSINSARFKAHRVIWAMCHGEWPLDQIDHINGARDDNRIINLRSVSNGENSKNQSMRITNSSGVMGVYWAKRSQKWWAEIQANGDRLQLGCFANFDDAVAARKCAERQFEYHSNHGRTK